MLTMKIIIPMTGYGSRFVAAGFKELKPFIEIEGKPIIEWIVNGMYPGETDILFICRKEHLDTIPAMEERLLKLCPTAEIYAVDDWIKKGPVNDVLRAEEKIPDDGPCIINYCDFYMTWDWEAFKQEVTANSCDGCIPCYTGFHPHLLRKDNVYASCKVDKNQNLIEIREKYSFEEDKLKANHSPGVYYFKSGTLLKKYCRKLIEQGPSLNGEFYASLPFNYMVKDGLRVWIPDNVIKFCQWGTPEDMNEFLFWNESVHNFSQLPNIVIPMAGEGKRFRDKGYELHKPVIPVTHYKSGRKLPMVVCAADDLPDVMLGGENITFIDRTEDKSNGVEKEILSYYPKASFITVDHLTEGQACSCMLAKDFINNSRPLFIAGCDNGMVFDHEKFEALKQECDCIVFTFRNNEAVMKCPDAYGWMAADGDGKIVKASIKKAISASPMNDHAVVSSFWFKRGEIFVNAVEQMIQNNDRINNEFYVDQTIKYLLEAGYDVRCLDVLRYIGWGTPEDYERYQKTMEYWLEFSAEGENI